MKTTTSLAILLAASVALNLWLGLSLSREGRRDRAQDQRPAMSHGVIAIEAPEVAHAREPSRPTTPSASQVEVEQLRDRVHALEQAEQSCVKPSSLPVQCSVYERFEKGAPDPDTKHRLESQLRTMLVSDAGSNPWSIECRDRVCKIDVLAANEAAWQDQRNALSHGPWVSPLIASESFAGGTPTQDVATGTDLMDYASYIDTRSERDIAALMALSGVVQQFRGSDAMRECTHGYSEKGIAEMVLKLDPAGVFHADPEGAGLGMTSVGACLHDYAMGLAGAANLPIPDSELSFSVNLRSPPDGP